jgi:serine/threonine-protein kinase
MPEPVGCPQLTELEEFLLGRLADTRSDEVEAHLAGCARCLQTVNNLEAEDLLVEAMRRAPGAQLSADSEIDGLLAQLSDLDTGPLPSGSATGGFSGRDGAQSSADGAAIHPQEDAAGLLDPAEAADELGRLGSYRVLRLLGTGGMGMVYLAQQLRPRRLVALKVVGSGSRLSRQRQERFRAEAEAAARLSHPNIVPVYEVGEHRGLPLFSMEYLEGGSLAQRLAATSLTPRAAAELLEALARAIAHAHERGVVHRDLKPGNVLLAADNTPKIADFGLAKLREAGPELEAGYQTETGAILGTPNYMAPEQAQGSKEIGPAADIHALGAILYETLTGRPPFRAASVLETLEQVRSQEPVTPSRLQPRLPRDLETICLKCLEKEPARRYPSAGALADDLGRFLRNEPILARPVSRAERLRKWVRRKPALAALLLVSILAAGGLLVGSLAYNARLRQEVERAEANAAEAHTQHERADGHYREARDTIHRMLGRLDDRRLADVPRLKELRRDQLEEALAFYQKTIDKLDSPDPTVRSDTAEAYELTAVLQQKLGRPGPAEQNYRQSIALLERLAEEQPENLTYRGSLAGRYNDLGLLLGDLGRVDESERLHLQALALRERSVQSHPTDLNWQGGVAMSHHNLGALYQVRKRLDRAEPHYREAIARFTRLVDQIPDSHEYRIRLADSHSNLGMLLTSTKRGTEAEAAFRQAEVLLQPLAGLHPDEPAYETSLAGTYMNWANLLNATGRTQEALDRANRAVQLTDEVLRREPRYAVGRVNAHNAHGVRAEVYQTLGRYAESIPDWDQVIALDKDPAQSRYHLERIIARVRAGQYARAVAEAEMLLRGPELADPALYNAACAYALSIQPARSDAALPESERAALAERYAREAMGLLHKLRARGYFKKPGLREHLKKDADLRPLAGRPDFERFVQTLEREAAGHP